MSTLTTNYKLVKPTLSESGDVRVTNANMDAIDSAIFDSSSFQIATGTSGNTIVLTLPSTLLTGYSETFIASYSNGGTATTINGKQFYKPNTTTPPTLIAGKAYTIWYNSAGGCFFIKASGEGDASQVDVLATKKFTNDNDSNLVGTMPDNGGTIITPSISNQAIPLGYQNGEGYVVGDADLISANVKAGANIFGVAGKSTVVDTTDASLDPAYLVTGYSGYDDGVKKAGELPNLTGIRSASGVSKWADGGLAVYPEKGYQKGGSGDGEIKVSVAQMQSVNPYLQSQYIVSGADIFGVSGTASIASLGGKKYASGTVTSSASKMTFNAAWAGADTSYYVNITGLLFTPNVAIIQVAGVAIGCSITSVNANHAYPINVVFNNGTTSSYTDTFLSGTGCIIANGQLLVPVSQASTTYTYYIYE